MSVSIIVETEDLYCPYCKGTHMHIEKPGGMMCLSCKRIHDGLSFKNLQTGKSDAPAEQKALG